MAFAFGLSRGHVMKIVEVEDDKRVAKKVIKSKTYYAGNRRLHNELCK